MAFMSQALPLSIKWCYVFWYPSFINMLFNSVNHQLDFNFFFKIYHVISALAQYEMMQIS